MKQNRWMFPKQFKLRDQRLLQLIHCCENHVGEALAQMPEDLLSRIQLRTVRWQIERVHLLRPAHLSATMTARTIEDHADRTVSQLVAQMLQEDLQAFALHRG